MKFRAHDTFFIRKGWLSKGMKNVALKPDIFVAKDENPMDVLGIGANMVKSLRYWLPTVCLTVETTRGKRIQTLTDFGTTVYANDRFIEELGTLFLLHYKLATNRNEATAWWFFFNEFSMSEFTREDFVAALQNYLQMVADGEPVAIRSLNDDFACIINTYMPRYKSNPGKVSAENNIDCPLGELGLIDILSRKTKVYKKAIPSVERISPWIAMAIISDQSVGKTEISLNELLTAPNNIGRILNLDAVNMLDLLYEVEKTGSIKIVRTAGLDIIHIQQQYTFQECVGEYYRSLQQPEVQP